MMDAIPSATVVEIAVSMRYARAHGWVVHALTGWLSAYYMEEPRFKVRRAYEDMETGVHVWICEWEGPAGTRVLLRRLAADIPPFQVRDASSPATGAPRHVLDLMDPTA